MKNHRTRKERTALNKIGLEKGYSQPRIEKPKQTKKQNNRFNFHLEEKTLETPLRRN